MKRIMVFGAAGLVGVYLTDELLSKGYEVIAVCHSEKQACAYKKRNIQSYSLDLSDSKSFDALPKSNIDTVILLAGLLPAGMKDYHPEQYFYVNTIGTLNVLEYCRMNNIKRILFTQSHSDVSGYWGKKTIQPYERRKINYKNDHTVYIISKNAAMDLLEHYYQQYGMKYAAFRCPNIYAYHPSRYYYVNGEKKIIAYRLFIDKAMKSETIEVWGNAHMKRDIVYVKDLNQLIRLAIEGNIKNNIYNVSNGKKISLLQQVRDTIKVFSPTDSPSKVVLRPDVKINDINYHYSISNAKKELGYKPMYYHLAMLEDMKAEMEHNRFSFLDQ